MSVEGMVKITGRPALSPAQYPRSTHSCPSAPKGSTASGAERNFGVASVNVSRVARARFMLQRRMRLRPSRVHGADHGCGSTPCEYPEYPDRYKELIMGAGGENIAPVPIEDNIKKVPMP
jgi:hypothetical protein